MSALLASFVLHLCDLALDGGVPAVLAWALVTDQIQGNPRKVARALMVIGVFAALLQVCGVRP